VLVDKATHVPHLEQLGEVGGQVQEFLGTD